MKISRIDNYGMKRLVLTLKSFVQSEGQQNTVHGLFFCTAYKLIMVFAVATRCRKKIKTIKQRIYDRNHTCSPRYKIFPIWSLKEKFS